MSPPLPLLALPVSFLLLLSYIPTLTLSFDVAQQPWPHNLPPHAKYWPEYGPLHRRSPQALGFGQLLLGAKPAGVKKMGGDEGEKFWPEYWMFEGGPGSNGTRQEDTEDEVEHHSRRHLQHFRLTDEDEEQAGNANISIPDNMPNTFQAPLRLHSEDHTLEDGPDHAYTHPLLRRLPAAFRRSTPLSKRQFQCPSGSTDCSSIGRPNSCCSPAETCQIIPDVGSGDVGCCPEGQRCLGDLMDCNTGFTQCSDDLGGGCCIPGYVCIDVGCGPGPGLVNLQLTTLTATTSRLSTTSSASSRSSSTTSRPSTTTTTTSASAFTCATGFQSCPASLGGGCCRTDRVCGPIECPASATSTTTGGGAAIAPNAPVRPTTGSTTSTSSERPETTLAGVDCPTGFYQCNAFYRGGCCRVGRDCGLTSCPATASSTVITRNGVTVVVPVGVAGGSSTSTATSSSGPTNNLPTTTSPPNAVAAGAGSCASGWYSCAASESGGCCPSGFSCATDQCRATASAAGFPAGPVGKIAPNGAAKQIGSGVLGIVGSVMMGLGGLLVWL